MGQRFTDLLCVGFSLIDFMFAFALLLGAIHQLLHSRGLSNRVLCLPLQEVSVGCLALFRMLVE